MMENPTLGSGPLNVGKYEICRLCMKTHAYYLNIFVSYEEFTMSIGKAIEDLLVLKVAKDDNLPKMVCCPCVTKLMELREFKEMCMNSAREFGRHAPVEPITCPRECEGMPVRLMDGGEGADVEKKSPNRNEACDPLAFDNLCPVKEEFLPMQLCGEATSGMWSNSVDGESQLPVAPNDLSLDSFAPENQTDTKEVFPRDPLGESDDCGEENFAETHFNEDAAVYSESKQFLTFDQASKIKDEDAADVETSREGSSQENRFGSDIHLTEVFITTPDNLAIGNVCHAKEELWSTENALMVKEEVNEGEHCIEGDVPMNVLAGVAVDPLAVNTMALKEDAEEPKVAAGEGNSLGDTSPHNHIRVTEVFVPLLDELAMGTVRNAEEDSRPTELIVKEEIGEGLECSENDVPVVTLSRVNVDPLAVDTTVDHCNNTGGLVMDPGNESAEFVADRQWISMKKVLNNPSFDPVREENLQPEHSMENSLVVNSLPEERVKNQKNYVEFNAVSKIFSQLNDWARPATNQEREQLCHQAENTCCLTDYICNYCSTRCSEKKSLALHIKTHMDGTKSARVLPKKDFPPSFSQRLLVKDQGHVEPEIQDTSNISFSPNNSGGVKPFKCNQCGKMFSFSSQLNTHSVVHTGVKAFKCNDCGKMFNRNTSLKRHYVVHSGVKAFKCNDCGKKFNQKNHLKIHSLIHTGVKAFKCNDCGKMFSRSRDLKRHLVVHSGVKAFKCKDCGKKFNQKNHLKIHSLIHTGVKPFECNECGKMFSRSSDLKRHLVVHSGVKAFKCKDCGKKFNQKNHLKIHSLIHTGVKAFKCNDCGKMFSQKNHLKIHLLIHAGVKPFECNECGKMFSKSSHLQRHSLVHTGVKAFKCNDCGKMFSRSSDLRLHSVVHTGVKRIKCNECGKMFSSSSNLKRHSVIHTGVKPSKCDFCGKQFKWRATFNRHLLTHADRNPSK